MRGRHLIEGNRQMKYEKPTIKGQLALEGSLHRKRRGSRRDQLAS